MLRFLLAPLSLLATGLFFWLFTRAESVVLLVLGAALVVAPLAWILLSVFSPAKPQRTCEECGKDGLVPLQPDAPTGVRCRLCGHVDEAASTALLDGLEDNRGQGSGVRGQEKRTGS